VNSGGQLYITGNQPIVGEALTLNGVGDGNGALRKGGAGLTTFGGSVTLAGDSTIGVDGGATIALTNTPALTGPGVLTKNGGGTLAMNSASTYAASIILDSGVLGYSANGAFGSGNVGTTPTSTGRILLADGTILTNTVTVDSVNPGTALGFIMVADNTNGTVTTVSSPLTFNADALSGGDIVGPTTSGYLSFTGPINLGGVATALSIRLGNARFSGGGTYSEIQVRANTTSLGANNGIPATAVMDLAGNGSPTVPTYFNLNGFNQTLAGLKNTVGPANLGVVTNSGAAATLTLDLGAGGPFSFSGNIAGNLALGLNSGTQILTGMNSYTGNTTINGGTLEITQPTLAANSTVTIASGAILQLDFGVTNTISALVLNGVNQPGGVYNTTTSPSFITGPGSLLVSAVATNPTNITAVVNGNQYVLSWPASHKGWTLQAQTNSLNVGISSNWATVPDSTATNQISVPINPANGSVFFRLTYP
jgi:autotransporter-associated beta strand protein